MEASSYGSTKRARAPYEEPHQIRLCVVDGCGADLSKCGCYHQRHRVCETHSKTATVTIRGHLMRFCQQCSKFHSVAEFDDGKRSCRKRLDGHNRRRRKPQPGSLLMNSGRLLSSQQGCFYPPFTTSLPLSSSPATPSAPSGSPISNSDTVLFDRSRFISERPLSVRSSYEISNDKVTDPPHSLLSQYRTLVPDSASRLGSTRALSLLSPPPQTCGMFHEIGAPDPMAAVDSSSAVEHGVLGSVLAETDGDRSSQDLFCGMGIGSDGSAAAGGLRRDMMSFYWE